MEDKKSIKLISLIEKSYGLFFIWRTSKCNFRTETTKLTAYGISEIESEINILLN